VGEITNMKKQSLLSIIIPLVLLAIGGFIFFLVTTQKQEIRSRAGVDMVDLTLSASPNPVAVESDVTVNVFINTKTYKVSAVELVMTYDSGAFDPVSITAGTFLPTVLTTGSIQSGTATITLGSGTTPKTGTGTLATLKLRKKTSANGVVNVGSQTTVAGQDANGVPIPTNILGTAGSVTITTPIITPTNVPTSSPTPTATITNTPTPAWKKGDFNHNGEVDIYDYNIIVANFGKTNVAYNLTGENTIDIFDYNMFVSLFGK
jgi:ABC-type Na+ efflux pump permease subunit